MLQLHITYVPILVFSVLLLCNTEDRSSTSTDRQGMPPLTNVIPLWYFEAKTVLIRSHCNSRLALFMGPWIVITFTFFEDMVNNLHYVGTESLNGSVTSAAFVLDNLVIVIDEKVYLHSLITATWASAQGVTSAVSGVSSLQCCFSEDQTCTEVSSNVLVYNSGSAVEDQQVFLSLDGGFNFKVLPMAFQSKAFVGGVYNMPTRSRIVAIVADENSMCQLQTDVYPMMDFLDRIQVIQPPGMRGHLIIWSPRMLLYSPNHGIVIVPVYEIGKENSPLPPPGIFILQVATDDNGVIAVLTSDGALYYGRVGLEATAVKFSSFMDVSEDILMMFTDSGDLTLIKARQDLLMRGVDFDQIVVIVQQELTRTNPPVQSCPVEQFHSDFEGQLFYIDMGSSVHLSAVYIPSPLCPFFPLVTVTDAELLAFDEVCLEDGITPEGNKKYRLDIELSQLEAVESTDDVSKPCSQKGSLSTVTVDLMGRDVSCKDLNPLKAHIIIGCPPGKHLRVLKNVTSCTKGMFSQEVLQDNFTYIIPKDVYDPDGLFRPSSAATDLHIQYNIIHYFCPLLVYHDMPWIPMLELWNGNEFVEYMTADFVMFEVNGMYSYGYLQSAQDAKCVSEPQNWTSMLANQSHPDTNTAWTRNNYKSCKDLDGPKLTDPNVQYQVLKMGSGNKIVFSNYNGMYIFKATVVDPSYSYCELSTTFSVYVYGAFPPAPLASGVALAIFLAIFVGLLLIGFFVSQHSSKE